MSTELLKALRMVKWDVYSGKFEIAVKYTGICDAVIHAVRSGRVSEVARLVAEEIKPLSEKWSKFSGCPAYPIPDPYCTDDDGTYEAREIFYAASDEEKMWDANTEYGKLRLELLDFCIKQLEQEL